MYALGMDPGVTTGLARVEFADGLPVVTEAVQVDSRRLGEWNACRTIMSWLHEQAISDPDVRFVVGVEDFVLRRMEMDRTLLSPVRVWSTVWGMLDANRLISLEDARRDPLLVAPFHPAGASLLGRGEIFVNSASNAKNTFDDSWLKRNDCWVKGKPHARDAVRHALLALQMNAPDPAHKPMQAALAARSPRG